MEEPCTGTGVYYDGACYDSFPTEGLVKEAPIKLQEAIKEAVKNRSGLTLPLREDRYGRGNIAWNRNSYWYISQVSKKPEFPESVIEDILNLVPSFPESGRVFNISVRIRNRLIEKLISLGYEPKGMVNSSPCIAWSEKKEYTLNSSDKLMQAFGVPLFNNDEILKFLTNEKSKRTPPTDNGGNRKNQTGAIFGRLQSLPNQSYRRRRTEAPKFG